MDIVSYQNQLFLNNEGRKIVGGRVVFLDPDSTNKIDVYTYNANDYAKKKKKRKEFLIWKN